MSDESSQPGGQPRRLAVSFAGWLDDPGVYEKDYFEQALIVLDANVLLALYEIGADARREVIIALVGVVGRLWVPYQAALEFSRNRKRVVRDRAASFKEVRRSLNEVTDKVTNLLEATVKQVVNLREKNRTLRSWDPADVQLDKSGLEDRFVGIMDSALAELQALEREHDVHPSDMQKTDSLFVEIDELLEGRIGAAPSQGKLRGRVDEAILFRYPNEIPPGYLDVGKKVPLVAAGDYLLWREVLDRAVMLKPGARYVLLVTSDMKPDWWLMNEKGKPLRARPELVQEIYEEAGARLLLVSLADFMNGARTHLAVDISDETVEQLREATSDPERDYGDLRLSRKNVLYLFSMSILDFERLLRDLLFAMGYAAVSSSPSVESGIDFRVRDASGLVPSRVVVQAKRYRHIVGAQVVRELLGAMVYLEVDAGVIIATSQFSSSARAIAKGKSMRLIDGAELVYLLAEHLGIQAALGVDPDRSDE